MNEGIDQLWRLSEELDEASRHPALIHWTGESVSSPEAQNAAFLFAVALGRCRLFGFEPVDEELRGALIWSMADAALREACRTAGRLSRKVKQVADELLELLIAFERHMVAIGVLQDRFDLEAVRIVLRESEAENIRESTTSPPLWDERMRLFETQLIHIDAECNSSRDVLCVIAETYWPKNVMRCLDPDKWNPRPWWLTDDMDRLYQEHIEWTAAFVQRGETMIDKLVLEYCSWTVESGSTPEHPDELVRLKEASLSVAKHRAAQEALGLSADAKWMMLVTLAKFSRLTADENQVVELRTEAKFARNDPRSLPDECTIRMILNIRNSGRFERLPQLSKWKVRLGHVMNEISVSRIGNHSIGDTEFPAAELRLLPPLSKGQFVTVRRIG